MGEHDRAVDIGTYKRISAATLGISTLILALLWAGTELPMLQHAEFPLYIALTVGFGIAAVVLHGLRAQLTLDTRLGQLLLHWLPEIFHLFVYKYWLPGVITMSCYLVVPLSSDRLVDGLLAWPEIAIGLEHPVTYAWFRDAGLLPGLAAIYPLVEQQTLLLFVICMLRRDLFRLWQYIAALAVCSALSVLFLYALPADGAWAFFEGRYGTPAPTPPSWLAELHALRSGTIGDLERAHGLLCFPSFHTVFAVLLARAWYDTKLLFVPLLVLNAAIIVATVPIGWHYLSDIASGLLLASFGAWLVDFIARWRRSRVPRSTPA